MQNQSCHKRAELKAVNWCSDTSDVILQFGVKKMLHGTMEVIVSEKNTSSNFLDSAGYPEPLSDWAKSMGSLDVRGSNLWWLISNHGSSSLATGFMETTLFFFYHRDTNLWKKKQFGGRTFFQHSFFIPTFPGNSDKKLESLFFDSLFCFSCQIAGFSMTNSDSEKTIFITYPAGISDKNWKMLFSDLFYYCFWGSW